MIEVFDVKNEYNTAFIARRKHIFIFAILTLFVVILNVTFILTSNDNYTLNLLGSIFVSILYLIYLVFYFSIIRKKTKNELDFFAKAFDNESNEELIEFVNFEVVKKENNGIEFFVMNAKSIHEINDVEKQFYVLNKIELKKGRKYNIKTVGKVILSLEETR